MTKKTTYTPRPSPPSDLSYRAIKTARVLTRLPDGNHEIKIVRDCGSFVMEIKTDDKVRVWSF